MFSKKGGERGPHIKVNDDDSVCACVCVCPRDCVFVWRLGRQRRCVLRECQGEQEGRLW